MPPPKAKAAVAVPAPANSSLEVFILLAVDQAPTHATAPVHSSVAPELLPGGINPPKFIADDAVPVFDVAPIYLVVFRSVVSVQLEPFHNSVFATTGEAPPEANAEVLLSPAEKTPALPVFKSPTSVQLDPLKDSVKA